MRRSGVLLPITSIPSKYGIGGFSKECYEFVDFLKRAGQSLWQILPLGPTGYGDSPYQSFSTYAGNPYFIDLEKLIEAGWITEEDCGRENGSLCGEGTSEEESRSRSGGKVSREESRNLCGESISEEKDGSLSGESVRGEISSQKNAPEDCRYVDYGKIYETRFDILRKAYRNSGIDQDPAFRKFCEDNACWLEDYALFMAVKSVFGGKSFQEWDEDIRFRKPEAMRRYRESCAEEIGFIRFEQYLFDEQWAKLRAYAAEKGIKIIGDIPIYVAYDSADVWSAPELFQLDEERLPVAVAGCPPDMFSATGQLWGNPLYRWDYHKETGYDWWIRRISRCYELYDILRIDHFRGFDEYYSIPYGDPTAEFGHWEKGPGIEIFQAIKSAMGKREVIAEDLGLLTPSVIKLVKKSGYPGMKVLLFAFDAGADSDYLPHHYEKNAVVYTGTHDNDTIEGWLQWAKRADVSFAMKYLGVRRKKDIRMGMIRAALSCVADTAVIPIQDYLGLDNSARINMPSTLGENWKWRLLPGELTEELARQMAELARLYGRNPADTECDLK